MQHLPYILFHNCVLPTSGLYPRPQQEQTLFLKAQSIILHFQSFMLQSQSDSLKNDTLENGN